MSWSTRWLLLILAIIVLIACGLIAWTMTLDHELDRVELNRIARTVEADWPGALHGQLPESQLSYSFVGSSAEDDQLTHIYSTHQDVRINVYIDGSMVGMIVASSAAAEQLGAMRVQLFVAFLALLALLIIGTGFYALYVYRTILRPFRKLESFAARVASGDLSLSLEMDRENRFGAFSESFDLMREQLALARENERQANISKKELVASLSHDIKTPVASIKVITELHQAKHGTTSEMTAIAGKADQVDLLISNMFTATLEELQQLEISVGEVTSTDLRDYIRTSDYQQRICPFTLPECVIAADKLRLQQVIDNIIGNSYKYAGTGIKVSGSFDDSFLILTIHDFGPGVSPEELPLLCEKYYRASNAGNKSGAGLGLYLSHYFLTKMGGSLTVENDDGLRVTLRLKI